MCRLARSLIPAATKAVGAVVLAATLAVTALGATGHLPARLIPQAVSIAVTTTALGPLPGQRK